MTNYKILEDEIMGLISQGCNHTYYYSNQRIKCVKVCQKINKIIGMYNKMSNHVVKGFLEMISKKSNSWYISDTCLDKNKDIFPILILVNTVYNFTSDDLIKLVPYRENDDLIKSISMDNSKEKFQQGLVLRAINSRLVHSCDEVDNKLLIDGLLDNFDDWDSDFLIYACKSRDSYFNQRIAGIIDKLDGEISKSHLHAASKHLPFTKATIRSIINRGVEPDSKCLEIACQFCDINSIQFLIETYRVPVGREHFQALVKAERYLLPVDWNYRYNRRYYYRGTPDESRFIGGGYDMDKMELLIKYGYVPDREDLEFSIKNRVEIPDVSRFGLKGDKDLLKLCHEHDFYPRYDFDCISDQMLDLQDLCTRRSKSKINSHLNTHKIVPDQKCMENACKFKNNSPTIDLLIKNGGKINTKCLINCASQFKANGTLMSILWEFDKSYKEEIKGYTDKIKELEDKIQSLKGSYLKEHTEANSKLNDSLCYSETTCSDGKSDTNLESAGTKQECISISNSSEDKGFDDIEDIKDIEDDELDEMISTLDDKGEYDKRGKKGKKGGKRARYATGKKAKRNKVKVIDDEEDQQNEPVSNTVYKNLIKNIPVQKRKKAPVPDKYASYFGVNKKTKLSYLDLKKDIIATITKNDWFDQNDKMLVNIPADLQNILKLDSNKIDFKDIDNFVTLFYN